MRQEPAPAFQMYPADEIAECVNFTCEEYGTYTKLRCHSWREGGLPNDRAKLARLAGLPPRRFEKVWRAIEPYSSQMADGRLSFPALEEQRRKYAANRALKQKAAEARWHSDSTAANDARPPSERNACALQTQSSAVADADAVATASSTERAEAEASQTSAAEAAPPAPLLSLSPQTRTAAEEFLATFYGGASDERRLDVARSIADALSDRGAFLRRGAPRVHARDDSHFVAKCVELSAERDTIRDPDRAIVWLLAKLCDPASTNGQRDARAIAATIRGLRQKHRTDTGRITWSIPLTDIDAMGADVRAAYDEVGGATAFTETPDEKLPFLARAFSAALARRSNGAEAKP